MTFVDLVVVWLARWWRIVEAITPFSLAEEKVRGLGMSGRRSGSALSCGPTIKKPPLSWTRQRRRRRRRCDNVSREVEWRVMVSPMKPLVEVVVAAKEWTQGLESWWLKRKRLSWVEEVVVRDYPLIRVLFKGIKESGLPLLFLRTPLPYCMHPFFVFHLGLLPSYTPFS